MAYRHDVRKFPTFSYYRKGCFYSDYMGDHRYLEDIQHFLSEVVTCELPGRMKQ